MDDLELNEEERKLVSILKSKRRIGNKEYQGEFDVSKPTATRRLEALVRKGLLVKVGTTGKGTYYTLGTKGLIKKKGLIKGSKESIQC